MMTLTTWDLCYPALFIVFSLNLVMKLNINYFINFMQIESQLFLTCKILLRYARKKIL